jgi:hypothetical protein
MVRQEGLDVQSVTPGPQAPDPLGGLDRAEEGAVHIEEEGGEGLGGEGFSCHGWLSVDGLS